MIDKINKWLKSSRDYSEGVALYTLYGHSASMKRIFSLSGPSIKNRNTLVYELTKLVKKAPAMKPATPKPAKQVVVKKKSQRVRNSSPKSKSKAKAKGAKTPRKSTTSKKSSS